MFQGISNLISKKIYSHALSNASHKDTKNVFRFYFTEGILNRFSSIASIENKLCTTHSSQNKTYAIKHLLQPQQLSKGQTRTLIKYSYADGKKITEEVVPQKFFRLHWGIWIRARAGCDKKLWKKSRSLRNRLQKIVFCNESQSKKLDKLVTDYWKKPKFYINDPYAPYHTREEFIGTRKKPWKPEGCDYE